MADERGRVLDAAPSDDALTDSGRRDATPVALRDAEPRDAMPEMRMVDSSVPDAQPIDAQPIDASPPSTWACSDFAGPDCLLPRDVEQWLPLAETFAGVVGPMSIETWFQVRQRDADHPALLAIAIPPQDDFRVVATVRYQQIAPQGDGRQFGYLGFQFAGETPTGGYPGTVTGLHLLPGRPLRLDYRGRTALGLGDNVSIDQPMTVFIERVGGRLRAGVNDFMDATWVPAPILTAPEQPPALVRLIATCIDCTLQVDELRVERLHNPPPRPWRTCANLLRNADFRLHTDAVPDFWGVALDWGATAAGWRAQLAQVAVNEAGLRLPAPGPDAPRAWVQQNVTIEGDACVDLRLTADADVAIQATIVGVSAADCPCMLVAEDEPNRWRAACAPGEAFLRLSADAPAQLHTVMLAVADAEPGFCRAWADDVPPIRPAPWVPSAIVAGPMPLRTLDGEPSGPVVIMSEFLGGWSLELPDVPGDFRVRCTMRHGEAPFFDDVFAGGVQVNVENVTPSGPNASGLQIVHRTPDGTLHSLAPLVAPEVSNPLAYARMPEFGRFRPIQMPRNAHSVHQSMVVPRAFDGRPFDAAVLQFFLDLGLRGVTLANPTQEQLPALFAAAAEHGDVHLDLSMYQFDAFWRTDGLATYARWADAAAAAWVDCATCRHLFTVMDEPLIHPLARCAADVPTSDRAQWLPALTNACADCSPIVRCQRAWPELLDTAINTVRDRLPPAMPVALNLTGDLGANLRPDAMLSWTWNWVGREQPAAWSLRFMKRLLAQEGPVAAYAPVAGTSAGWRPRRAPSAAEHRAQIALLAASGAHTVRLFAWPPNSAALVDAIQEIGLLLTEYWPMRWQPLESTHVGIRFFRNDDGVILVINSTARRVRVLIGSVSLGGPDISSIVWGAGDLIEADSKIYAVLPPFGAILAQ